MVYFISGHRDLTDKEFAEHYIPMLSKIIEDDLFADFVVGDCEGCDKKALEFLLSQPNYNFISIYYTKELKTRPMGSHPENFEKVFTYEMPDYNACDEAMTCNSDFDVAWVRPGKENSYTANNIRRRYGFNN